MSHDRGCAFCSADRGEAHALTCETRNYPISVTKLPPGDSSGTAPRKTTAETQVARVFSPEEMKAFEEKADYWVKNRNDLGQHLVRQALIFMQMQEEISKNPGTGRSAMTNQRTATNTWFGLAEKALEILGKEKEDAAK